MRSLSRAIAMSCIFGLMAPQPAVGAPTTVVVASWFPQRNFDWQLKRFAELLAAEGLARGIDYEFEYHQVRSQQELDRALARQGDRPHVVYTTNTSPAEFVIRNGTLAPHVFATYSDPLADGWSASYARPGKALTGVVEYAAAHEKRLELLTRLLPSVKRIAVIAENGQVTRDVRDAMKAFEGRHGNIRLSIFAVAAGDHPAGMADRLRTMKVDGAYVPMRNGAIDEIAGALYRALNGAGVPAIAERRHDISLGAVLALEVDRSELTRRLAHQLALVLTGTPAGSIPVHSPRRFQLAVNLDAARRLAITVPRGLLRQADFIIADGK
jgi:putative tryptophan/tyrosine transport system substrate-binding protein